MKQLKLLIIASTCLSSYATVPYDFKSAIPGFITGSAVTATIFIGGYKLYNHIYAQPSSINNTSNLKTPPAQLAEHVVNNTQTNYQELALAINAYAQNGKPIPDTFNADVKREIENLCVATEQKTVNTIEEHFTNTASVPKTYGPHLVKAIKHFWMDNEFKKIFKNIENKDYQEYYFVKAIENEGVLYSSFNKVNNNRPRFSVCSIMPSESQNYHVCFGDPKSTVITNTVKIQRENTQKGEKLPSIHPFSHLSFTADYPLSVCSCDTSIRFDRPLSIAESLKRAVNKSVL